MAIIISLIINVIQLIVIRHYIDLIARYRISPRSEVESKVV